ncbi:MAG: hypothetical protein ACRDRH_04800 [Pseudonocardia sp.]
MTAPPAAAAAGAGIGTTHPARPARGPAPTTHHDDVIGIPQ